MRVHFRLESNEVFTDLGEFRRCYPQAEALTVDGRVFHGECAKCSRLILGADRYREYELGERLCEECCQ